MPWTREVARSSFVMFRLLSDNESDIWAVDVGAISINNLWLGSMTESRLGIDRFCCKCRAEIEPNRVARGSFYCSASCRQLDRTPRRRWKAQALLPPLWASGEANGLASPWLGTKKSFLGGCAPGAHVGLNFRSGAVNRPGRKGVEQNRGGRSPRRRVAVFLRAWARFPWDCAEACEFALGCEMLHSISD